MSEPTLRDQLLADYDAHEDAIERASVVELWALADWLAKYVPRRHPGPKGVSEGDFAISLDDLAARGRRTARWLQELRKLAEVTAPDRLPHVSPTAYHEALRPAKWDLMAANKRLVTRGHRWRDQREGPHESVDAIGRELGKHSPQERADFVREQLADPTVADLLDGEDPASFGEEWAERIILRLHENADRLTAHVAQWGLRFAPSTELREMWEFLTDVEQQVAEVRAAVQERMNDERAEATT